MRQVTLQKLLDIVLYLDYLIPQVGLTSFIGVLYAKFQSLNDIFRSGGSRRGAGGVKLGRNVILISTIF